jgi:2-polyprenyl-6-hydroxyphenyl methylase/3-demethylubiquinone-9 3-methyltransferase
MGTLVCFHAHPDDESISTGGSMARAKDEGHRVVLVVATDGDHGEVPDDLADGETLVDRRKAETARSAEVLGIDLSSKSLKVAQLHALEAQTPGVSYREVSAEALATEQPACFDVVTCMEMLEHVPDPASVVQACATLVKPGGWVFFSTLNRNPQSFLFAIVGAEYVLNLLPKGTHEYAKFIRPSELAAFCRDAGLQTQASRGLQYNPLTQRYWLDANTRVNYMLATQREI